MSWHCSLALVEEFSRLGSSEPGQCAALSNVRIGERSCYGAKRRDTSDRSLFGMMLEPSTADRGVASWMLSVEEIPAKTSPACTNTGSTVSLLNRLAKSSLELLEKYGPPASSGKTLGLSEHERHAVPIGLPTGWSGWVTPRSLLASGRVVWGLTIDATGCSCSPYYPTPIASTGGPDFAAPGRPGTGGNKLATTLRLDGNAGPPNPEFLEQLMGWPIGWTDMRPLEKAKFQQWLGQHGSC